MRKHRCKKVRLDGKPWDNVQDAEQNDLRRKHFDLGLSDSMKYIGWLFSKSCISWYACCIVLISLFGCEWSNLLECQFCFLVHLLLSSIPQRTSGCLCWTRINKFKGRPQNSVRLVYHPVYCLENFAKLHFFCCTCFHFLKNMTFGVKTTLILVHLQSFFPFWKKNMLILYGN